MKNPLSGESFAAQNMSHTEESALEDGNTPPQAMVLESVDVDNTMIRFIESAWGVLGWSFLEEVVSI